jgi:hypothetical protein
VTERLILPILQIFFSLSFRIHREFIATRSNALLAGEKRQRRERQMFERRDVWVLGSEADPWHPILRWYARAIADLKGRARMNPTSWPYLAAIHDTSIPRIWRSKKS